MGMDGSLCRQTVPAVFPGPADRRRCQLPVIRVFAPRAVWPANHTAQFEGTLGEFKLPAPHPDSVRPLDLILFNHEPNAWGAHVAVYMANDQLLHLCAEVGQPTTWSWANFAARPATDP